MRPAIRIAEPSRPVNAVDAELRVDNRIHLAAHAAGPDGVKIRDAARADIRLEVRFARDLRPRQDLLDNERPERRLPRDLATDAHAVNEGREVCKSGRSRRWSLRMRAPT